MRLRNMLSFFGNMSLSMLINVMLINKHVCYTPTNDPQYLFKVLSKLKKKLFCKDNFIRKENNEMIFIRPQPWDTLYAV